MPVRWIHPALGGASPSRPAAFHDQPARGPLCKHAAANRFRSYAVIAAAGRMRRRLSSGDGPRSERQKPFMSLDAAQRYAWNLACTLKVIIILITTDSGYQVMTSDDYDGDADKIVREYDPWAA